MKKIIVSLSVIISVCMVFLLDACKKSSHNTQKVAGYVVDESGAPITAATVTILDQTVSVSGDGSFLVTGLSNATSYRITVSGPGYFDAYKNVSNIDGSNIITKIIMLAANNLGTLSSSGGSVGSVGLRVVASANSFKNADGTVYNGMVSVAAKYVDKNNANIATAMPGGDYAAIDQNGNNGGMHTYGFVATKFTDPSGNQLQAGNGVQVAITLPSGVPDPTTNGGFAWGYDPTSGSWTTPATITKTGNEYFFPCTTLYENVDNFVGFGTLNGTVTCSSTGQPAPYVTVTIQSQYNDYQTTTNANGKFQAKVEYTHNGLVYTVTAEGGSSTTESDVPTGSTVNVSLTSAECSNPYPGPNGNTINGAGTFAVGTTNYSGPCNSVSDVSGCSGLDVTISTTSGYSFIIYNMPGASSGTFNFTDGFQNVGGCTLYGLTTNSISGTGNEFATQSGTLTKTGANSFTFSGTVYDLNTGNTYTASGRGTY